MDWKKIKEKLIAIQSELEKLRYPETLSQPFYKLRELVERYFQHTNYLNDLGAGNYMPSEENEFWREQERYLGIIKGLLTKVDLIIEEGGKELSGDAFISDEYSNLIKLRENLAKQNELAKEELNRLSTEIKNLNTRLEQEKKLQEDRFQDLSKVELLKQEEIFTKAGKLNRIYSWLWLLGIIAATIVLVCFLGKFVKDFCIDMSCVENYKTNCPDCNYSWVILELVRSSIYRIAIISIIVYLLVFTVKNYNATMHNYTINVHKANSFAAAFVMINGTITEKGKDDIMTYAAQAIFSHQNSGYIGKDNEPSNPLLVEKIIEKISPK